MSVHVRRAVALAAATLAAATVACTTAPGGSSPGAHPSNLPMRSLPSSTIGPETPPMTGEAPAPIVTAARDDLAERVGSGPASSADVVQSETVSWPDGSLGCPVPGLFYQPIVTPGYRIVFSVGGATYDYRATEAGVVSLCEHRVPGG